MSSEREPLRLCDDEQLPAELRELRDVLKAGRANQPSAQELERVLSALSPVLELPLPDPGPSPSQLKPADPGLTKAGAGASKAGFLSQPLKWTLGALLLGGGVAWLAWPTPPKSVSPALVVTQITPPAASAELLKAAPITPEPTVLPKEPLEPAQRASPKPLDSANKLWSTAEVQLLETARAALPGNPARALEITRVHERRFAAGALLQEREVIAISALRRLGRKDEAQKRAAAFEHRFPSSAHLLKINAD